MHLYGFALGVAMILTRGECKVPARPTALNNPAKYSPLEGSFNRKCSSSKERKSRCAAFSKASKYQRSGTGSKMRTGLYSVSKPNPPRSIHFPKKCTLLMPFLGRFVAYKTLHSL